MSKYHYAYIAFLRKGCNSKNVFINDECMISLNKSSQKLKGNRTIFLFTDQKGIDDVLLKRLYESFDIHSFSSDSNYVWTCWPARVKLNHEFWYEHIVECETDATPYDVKLKMYEQ